MADIIPFRKPRAADKHRGKSLCRDGLHKWVVDTRSKFDVKLGKLVSLYRCARCGQTKTRAD